jgi:hypothetical protein
MHRFNLFQINTAKLVNMREAQKFSDKPLARASAGLVEVCSQTFGCMGLCWCKLFKYVAAHNRIATAFWCVRTAAQQAGVDIQQILHCAVCLCRHNHVSSAGCL